MYEDRNKVVQPSIKKHLTSFISVLNTMEQVGVKSMRDRKLLQPHYHYFRELTMPTSSPYRPADGICSHFLQHGYNRQRKSPVYVGCWSSDGRRLVLGTQLGEFTLWEV
jgi:hypothetical protein